jgi:hypothetical protein
MTEERIARPIVKNKYWIVEDHGQKVATIQAVEEGGFVYVHDDRREPFASIKVLSRQYNIVFDKPARKTAEQQVEGNHVYGFPTQFRPHNKLYDVQRKLPIFTKTAKSKSYFCAGYYIIKFDSHWARATCPKLITLNRYEFRGPYLTSEQMQTELKAANGS